MILIPLDAHVPIGLSHLECWDDKLVIPFLDGADLEKLDASCAEEMK